MTDPHFYQQSGDLTLQVLADIAGATLRAASPEQSIEDIAPLEDAGSKELSFLDNRRYVPALKQSKAGACVLREADATHAPKGMALLITPQPYPAFALMAQALYPQALRPSAPLKPGVDPAATVGKGSQVAETASIGPGAMIGEACIIDHGAVIGPGVQIGDQSYIGPHVSVFYAKIGHHAILHPGARIGQDGFGFAPSPQGVLKVPQLGRVIIGNHVEIGANSTVDRGSNRDTIIGDHTKIDNLVQIGHNVEIGSYCFFASQVGVSGSVKIGDQVMLGGQTGVAGHLTIGDGVQSAGQTGIIQDIPAGSVIGGTPSVPVRQWHRQAIALAKLVKNKRTSA